LFGEEAAFSQRYLSSAHSYQSLPVDQSEKADLAEKSAALGLLDDDMNNWTGAKYLIAEGDHLP